MAAFPSLLAHDRQREGLSVVQAARRLGMSPAAYRELEAGTRWPTWEQWDRICKTYGWPQTFVSSRRG